MILFAEIARGMGFWLTRQDHRENPSALPEFSMTYSVISGRTICVFPIL